MTDTSVLTASLLSNVLLGRGVLRKHRGSAHIGMQELCKGSSLGTPQLFDESPNMPWFLFCLFSVLFCEGRRLLE